MFTKKQTKPFNSVIKSNFFSLIILGAKIKRNPNDSKNKSWFTAIDFSAYLPFKKATNNDLCTFNKKFSIGWINMEFPNGIGGLEEALVHEAKIQKIEES